MAVAERNIKVIARPTSNTEEDSRVRAEIDSHMTILRHHRRFADRKGAEYLFREMVNELTDLSRKFGFALSDDSLKVLRRRA